MKMKLHGVYPCSHFPFCFKILSPKTIHFNYSIVRAACIASPPTRSKELSSSIVRHSVARCVTDVNYATYALLHTHRHTRVRTVRPEGCPHAPEQTAVLRHEKRHATRAGFALACLVLSFVRTAPRGRTSAGRPVPWTPGQLRGSLSTWVTKAATQIRAAEAHALRTCEKQFPDE